MNAMAQRVGDEIKPATWFVPALVLVVVFGVALRIAYAVVWENGTLLGGDPQFFQHTAAQLSHGHGYTVDFAGTSHLAPTALHPPMFSIVLALLDVARVQSPEAHRIALAFISAVPVTFMGLIGRRLMSPVVGLVAAAFAAFSPLWVQWGGRLLSESLYLVVIPVLLWVALTCVDRPSWLSFGVVGVLTGVATLTRSEALAFVVVLGAPLVLLGSSDWRRRASYALALVAGAAIIVGPWLVRNEVQLGGLTLTTDSGTTWAGANTAGTFSPANPLYGSFDNTAQYADTYISLKFGKPPDGGKAWNERTLEDAIGQGGMAFARHHLSDLPGVVLAREGRLWGVYAIGSQLQYDTTEEGGSVRGFFVAGQFVEWFSIPLAIAGCIVLGRHSRRRVVVIVAPVVVAALNAAVFYGTTRLRVVAEPSLLLLASIGLVSTFHWLARRVNSPNEPDNRTVAGLGDTALRSPETAGLSA
jgi:hypothetical protein